MALPYYTLSLFILFSFSIQLFQAQPCPTDCGNGFCINATQTCSCYLGSFGSDCSIDAIQLEAGAPQYGEISSTLSYFYFLVEQAPGNLRFTIQKPKGITAFVNISVQNTSDFTVPDVLDGVLFGPTKSVIWTNFFAQNWLNANIGQQLFVIGVSSSDGVERISVSADYQSDPIAPGIDGMVVMAILLPVVGTVLCLLLLPILAFRRRQQQLQMMRAPNLEIGAMEELSAEEREKFFPAKEYSQFENLGDKQTCCICLDDFEPNTLCIQLYCEHIHHKECSERWLRSHNTCPECRKSMKAEDLREHFGKVIGSRQIVHVLTEEERLHSN